MFPVVESRATDSRSLQRTICATRASFAVKLHSESPDNDQSLGERTHDDVVIASLLVESRRKSLGPSISKWPRAPFRTKDGRLMVRTRYLSLEGRQTVRGCMAPPTAPRSMRQYRDGPGRLPLAEVVSSKAPWLSPRYRCRRYRLAGLCVRPGNTSRRCEAGAYDAICSAYYGSPSAPRFRVRPAPCRQA